MDKERIPKNQEILLMPINELINKVLDGTITLREVSQPHVKSIKQYILSHLASEQVFLPPLIAHSDGEGDLPMMEQRISIIDGSHRMKAIIQLHHLAKKAIKGKDENERQKAQHLLNIFEESFLAVQLYQGLTVEEQHQYYLDINSVQRQISSLKWTTYLLEKKNGRERSVWKEGVILNP